jgi:hypothetical protein
MSSVFLTSPRDHFQAVYEFGCIHSAVCLDQPHHNVYAFTQEPVALLEHLICFAHSRAVAQVNLQPAPAGAANHAQEGIGSIFGHSFSGHLASRDRFNVKTFTLAPIFPWSSSVWLAPCQNRLFANASHLGNTAGLYESVPYTDMGIQTAGRGCHGIGRHWNRRWQIVFRAVRLDPFLY